MYYQRVHDAATVTANGPLVDVSGCGVVAIQITVSGFTGSVAFKGAIRGNAVADLAAVDASDLATKVTSATGAGIWYLNVRALDFIQLPATVSVGSVTVDINCSDGAFSLG